MSGSGYHLYDFGRRYAFVIKADRYELALSRGTWRYFCRRCDSYLTHFVVLVKTVDYSEVIESIFCRTRFLDVYGNISLPVKSDKIQIIFMLSCCRDK